MNKERHMQENHMQESNHNSQYGSDFGSHLDFHQDNNFTFEIKRRTSMITEILNP